LPHPGGPKVEELAKQAAQYIALPYTVKGMDFSFSGLTTAAQDLQKNSLYRMSAIHSKKQLLQCS